MQAVVKRARRRWLATVCYEVEAVKRPDDGRVLGVDRNAGQVAVADGVTTRLVPGPSQHRLEARRRRYQRRMARQRRDSNRRNRTRRRLAKAGRELANRRKNWCHHVSRELGSSTVVLEELKTGSMTRSARGRAQLHGEERFAPERTPATRETDRRRAA